MHPIDAEAFGLSEATDIRWGVEEWLQSIP